MNFNWKTKTKMIRISHNDKILSMSILAVVYMVVYTRRIVLSTTMFNNEESEVTLFDVKNFPSINERKLEFEKNEHFWVPYTYEEKQEMVKRQASPTLYEHCRLGQSRKAEDKCDFDRMLWKWNEERPGAHRLANMSDLLNHLEGRKLYPEKSCNILFVGDSLSADHCMAMNCEAANIGYRAKSCVAPGNSSKYGADGRRVCERKDHKFGHFSLERDNGSCKNLFIGTISPDGKKYHNILSALARNSAFSNGFIVVYNWSIHCNTKNDCIRPMIEDTLIPYVNEITYKNFWQRQKFANWVFLYREHEPQHFSTPGGLYDNSTEFGTWRKRCTRALVKPDNWRNEEVRQIFHHFDVFHRVPIIPIFHALEPLSWMHSPPDCTHYCYSPNRFEVTWDGIIHALKEAK